MCIYLTQMVDEYLQTRMSYAPGKSTYTRAIQTKPSDIKGLLTTTGLQIQPGWLFYRDISR